MDKVVDKIETLLPNKKISIFGKDQLMHNTFPYYLLAVLMMIGVFGGI